MTEWLQFVAIFVGVTIVAFAVATLLRLLWRKPDPYTLEEDDQPPTLILGPLTEAFANQLPMTRASQAELEKELRSPGYYQPTAVMEYRAVRALLVLATAVGVGTVALLIHPTRLVPTLAVGALLITVAFCLPRLVIYAQARRRARVVERSLPLAIDLLILCLSAGQNLLEALKQTAKQLAYSRPVLARELAITHRLAELHSLEYALKQWANRMPAPDVRNLALLLVQSDKLGTDAASTLQELATNFRTNSRQRAEAHANRTSFWMLFPSVFCFWVAAAIVLLGPAYLEFFQFRERSSQYFNQVGPAIERANQPSRRPAANDGTPSPTPSLSTSPNGN